MGFLAREYKFKSIIKIILMAIILVRYTDIERWKKTGKRVLV
jgi:hypothetical protein